MDLPEFLLDQWLSKFGFASSPVEYHLASSTGPHWSLADLMALGKIHPDFDDISLKYAPADGSLELRRAVARFYDVDSDWVVVTTGASEALSLLLCLAAHPGGDVTIPNPSYPAYAAMAQAWGLGVNHYILRRDQSFAQDCQNVLSAINANTAGVIVNTPHNPTGSVMATGELETLANELHIRRIPLIVDEVFHPLYFRQVMPSAAAIDNVIVIGDMSKALSLPGLRIGWIIDRDANRRKKMLDARSYFSISGSPLLETIATHALNNHGAILDRVKAVALANLGKLASLVSATEGRLAWAIPAGGTTCFPWFSEGCDSRPFCERLAHMGVLVVPGDCFAHPDHIRIGFAQQADGFDIAMKRMERAILS